MVLLFYHGTISNMVFLFWNIKRLWILSRIFCPRSTKKTKSLQLFVDNTQILNDAPANYNFFYQNPTNFGKVQDFGSSISGTPDNTVRKIFFGFCYQNFGFSSVFLVILYKILVPLFLEH